MPIYRYTLTEYQPDKPWLIKSQSSGLEVELPDLAAFGEWAREHWRGPRYAASRDPGQLGPLLRRG